jgi:hypothetical protein
VISRRAVTVLVAGFATLGVAFSLLMAAANLVAALGDAFGATVLGWVAFGCGILVALDLVLLVVALGLIAIDQAPRQDEDDQS